MKKNKLYDLIRKLAVLNTNLPVYLTNRILEIENLSTVEIDDIIFILNAEIEHRVSNILNQD